MRRMTTRLAPLVMVVAILVATTAVVTIGSADEASAITTNQGWADSYDVNGKCYCASTFDHGIGDVRYEGRTVRQICNELGAGPSSGRTYYNTIQCGHEPAHRDSITINGRRVQDEVVCPGRVGRGVECNSEKGARWDLGPDDPDPRPTTTTAPPRSTTTQAPTTTQRQTTTLAPTTTQGQTTTRPTVDPDDPSGECRATGANLGAAKKAYAQTCSAPRVDCDPMPTGGWVCSSRRMDANNPVTTTTRPVTTTTTPPTTTSPTTAPPTTQAPDPDPDPDGLVLDIVNATSDLVVGTLSGTGRSFAPDELPSAPLGFDLATVPEGTRSVVFTIGGDLSARQVENYAPYASFGNAGPNFYGRNLGPGSYTIRVEAYAGRQGSGAKLADETLSFEIRS